MPMPHSRGSTCPAHPWQPTSVCASQVPGRPQPHFLHAARLLARPAGGLPVCSRVRGRPAASHCLHAARLLALAWGAWAPRGGAAALTPPVLPPQTGQALEPMSSHPLLRVPVEPSLMCVDRPWAACVCAGSARTTATPRCSRRSRATSTCRPRRPRPARTRPTCSSSGSTSPRRVLF